MDANELRVRVQRAAECFGRALLKVEASNDALRDWLGVDDASSSRNIRIKQFQRSLISLIHQMMAVFLLEDRGLIPSEARSSTKEGAVGPHSSPLSTLRYRMGRDDTIQAHESTMFAEFQTLLAGLYHGSVEFGLPCIGSALFAPGFTGLPSDIRVLNGDLQDVFDTLCWENAPRRLEPLDWSRVDMNTLGSVHEGLLELSATYVPDDEQGFSLGDGEENDRKSSGSFYTPTPLVELLVDDLVEPLLMHACEEATLQTGRSDGDEFRNQVQENILSLTICDPACGTGNFLIAAMNRMALALVNLENGSAMNTASFTRWKGEVSLRCLYGVDLNPLALELCKLAIWLEAEDDTHPVSALDGHFKHGNGLIGQQLTNVDILAPLAAFEGWTSAGDCHHAVMQGIQVDATTTLRHDLASIVRQIEIHQQPKAASFLTFERDPLVVEAEVLPHLIEARESISRQLTELQSTVQVQRTDLVQAKDLQRVLLECTATRDHHHEQRDLRLQWIKRVLDASIAVWWWPKPRSGEVLPPAPLSGFDLHRYATWLAHEMGIGKDVLQSTVQGPERFESEQSRFQRITSLVEDLAAEHSFFHWEVEFYQLYKTHGEPSQRLFSGMLANPPFISAWNMHDHAETARRFIKASERGLKKHWDLASAFLLVGRRLASSTAYVLPTGILTEKHGDSIRRLLLSSNTNVTDWTGRSWFPEATVDVFVAIQHPRTQGWSQRFLGEQGLSTQVPLEDVFETIGDQVLYVPEPVDYAAALREHADPLGCHVHLNYGVQANPKEKGGSKDDNIYECADACAAPKPYAEAKHILDTSIVDVAVDVRLWLDYDVQRLYGPRTPAFFEAEKLVIKHVSNSLDVYIDRSGLYMNHSVVLCVPHHHLPEGEDDDFGYARLNCYSIDQLHLLLQNRFTVEHYLRHIKGSVNNYPKSIREILVPRVEPEALQTILALPVEGRQAAVDDLVGSLIGK